MNAELSKEEKSIKGGRWKMVVVLLLLASAIGLKIYNTWWWPEATVKIRNTEFRVLVADTPNRQFQGWSSRDSMGKYQGMLFYFSTRDQHTMVMRKMRFPLDIIWIDHGKIVDIAQNLPPEDGRSEAELTPYFARLPSTMVLELAAGEVARDGIEIGDEVIMGR